MLVESYAGAPELGTNLLAEIEVELAEFTTPGEDINLPVQTEVPEVISGCQEDAPTVLGEQLVMREVEIADSEPLRGVASTSDAGPSRSAVGDIMSLLDDALLDTDHVAMQMESHRRFGIYVEVSLSTLGCRVPIVDYDLLDVDANLVFCRT